jgi:hypothetical protein
LYDPTTLSELAVDVLTCKSFRRHRPCLGRRVERNKITAFGCLNHGLDDLNVPKSLTFVILTARQRLPTTGASAIDGELGLNRTPI